jgi:anthranilate phosphoribosyltransferase
VKVDCEPQDVEKIINKIGIGFMFAPKFHPAMKFAMPVRKSLAMRTIFNILGPLTNPACAQNQILGVFDKTYLKPIAQVLANLNTNHAFVVHSEPHIDEIVPVSKVFISEINQHEITSETITEKQFQSRFKMDKVKIEEMEGGSPENNTKIAVNILKDTDKGAKRQVAVLNAAYAILLGGNVTDLGEAINMANTSIKSGSAREKLKALVTETNGNMAQYKKVFEE